VRTVTRRKKQPDEEQEDLPLEDEDEVADAIRSTGVVDAQSARDNEDANRVITAKRNGARRVQYPSRGRDRYNQCVAAFGTANRVAIKRIRPSEAELPSLPLTTVPEYDDLIRYLQRHYWDGEETAFQWKIYDGNVTVRAQDTLTLPEDPRQKAAWLARSTAPHSNTEPSMPPYYPPYPPFYPPQPPQPQQPQQPPQPQPQPQPQQQQTDPALMWLLWQQQQQIAEMQRQRANGHQPGYEGQYPQAQGQYPQAQYPQAQYPQQMPQPMPQPAPPQPTPPVTPSVAEPIELDAKEVPSATDPLGQSLEKLGSLLQRALEVSQQPQAQVQAQPPPPPQPPQPPNGGPPPGVPGYGMPGFGGMPGYGMPGFGMPGMAGYGMPGFGMPPGMFPGMHAGHPGYGPQPGYPPPFPPPPPQQPPPQQPPPQQPSQPMPREEQPTKPDHTTVDPKSAALAAVREAFGMVAELRAIATGGEALKPASPPEPPKPGEPAKEEPKDPIKYIETPMWRVPINAETRQPLDGLTTFASNLDHIVDAFKAVGEYVQAQQNAAQGNAMLEVVGELRGQIGKLREEMQVQVANASAEQRRQLAAVVQQFVPPMPLAQPPQPPPAPSQPQSPPQSQRVEEQQDEETSLLRCLG